MQAGIDEALAERVNSAPLALLALTARLPVSVLTAYAYPSDCLSVLVNLSTCALLDVTVLAEAQCRLRAWGKVLAAWLRLLYRHSSCCNKPLQVSGSS